MSSMLFATFRDRRDADRAVDELYSIGYEPHDLSVVAKGDAGVSHSVEAPVATNATEGLTTGLATGGIIGGLAGLLAGAGVLPALAGLFFGGPIAAALGLTGAAAITLSGALSGAAIGGLVGVLTGLGLSDEDAEYYEAAVDRGDVLIGAPIQENHSEEDLVALLEDHGGEQVRVVEMELPESGREEAYPRFGLSHPAVTAYRKTADREAELEGREDEEYPRP